MNFIDRYITAVGKHLFTRKRSDIQNEIRSTLEDMLEDRSRKEGREPDEEMIVSLIKEFGRPEKVAAAYSPDNHLIGDQFYPIYLLILKIVLPVLAVVLLITSLFGLLVSNPQPDEILVGVGKMFLEMLGAVISAVGAITITFAILERIPGIKSEFTKEWNNEDKDWNPRHLPEAREAERFSISNLVFDMVFTIALLVIFNFVPEIVGITSLSDGVWTTIPLLSDAFFTYLPFLNILWGLSILLDVALLSRGQWETWSRLTSLLARCMAIAMAGVMLGGPSLVNVPIGMDVGSLNNLLEVISRQAVVVILLLTILSNLVTVLRLIMRLTGRNLPPALVKFAHP